jgi:hypothetical protein
VKTGGRVATFAEAMVAEERLERVDGLTQSRSARRGWGLATKTQLSHSMSKLNGFYTVSLDKDGVMSTLGSALISWTASIVMNKIISWGKTMKEITNAMCNCVFVGATAGVGVMLGGTRKGSMKMVMDCACL